MSGYRRLDFDKLHFVETPISYEKAVKDVVPFEVPDDVVSRKREHELLGYAKRVATNFRCYSLFSLIFVAR